MFILLLSSISHLVICLSIIYSFRVFLHQCQLMVFHWSLNDSKSPQVSRTRLRILVVLSNAVIWIVSTRPPTSKYFRPFNNLLVTVPKAPITIVTFMFHSFFQFSSKVEVLILLFTAFQFYSVVSRDSKVENFANSLFLLLIKPGHWPSG